MEFWMDMGYFVNPLWHKLPVSCHRGQRNRGLDVILWTSVTRIAKSMSQRSAATILRRSFHHLTMQLPPCCHVSRYVCKSRGPDHADDLTLISLLLFGYFLKMLSILANHDFFSPLLDWILKTFSPINRAKSSIVAHSSTCPKLVRPFSFVMQKYQDTLFL